MKLHFQLNELTKIPRLNPGGLYIRTWCMHSGLGIIYTAVSPAAYAARLKKL